MATKVGATKGPGPSKAGFFVPERVRPPVKGESLEQYRAYLACYEAYVQYLDFSKKKFWSEKKRGGLEYASSVVPPGEPDPLIQRVSQKTVVLKAPVLDVRIQKDSKPLPAPARKKEADKTPGSSDPQQKLARKKAKLQRRRQRKKEARKLAEIERLKLDTKLAVARKSYAAVTGSGPKQPIQPKKKGKKAEPQPAKEGETPLKKGKKPERKPKGKGPKGPRPPGPPGPPGEGGGTSGAPGAPSGDEPEKDLKSTQRPPNRKERRRAIYGPPGGVKESSAQRVESPVPVEAPEEEESSESEEEVVPFVNPFAAPVIGGTSRLEAVASQLGTLSDAPITGRYPTFLANAGSAALAGLGGAAGYGSGEETTAAVHGKLAWRALSGGPTLRGHGSSSDRK